MIAIICKTYSQGYEYALKHNHWTATKCMILHADSDPNALHSVHLNGYIVLEGADPELRMTIDIAKGRVRYPVKGEV